jgi:hypothetical protein
MSDHRIAENLAVSLRAQIEAELAMYLARVPALLQVADEARSAGANVNLREKLDDGLLRMYRGAVKTSEALGKMNEFQGKLLSLGYKVSSPSFPYQTGPLDDIEAEIDRFRQWLVDRDIL